MMADRIREPAGRMEGLQLARTDPQPSGVHHTRPWAGGRLSGRCRVNTRDPSAHAPAGASHRWPTATKCPTELRRAESYISLYRARTPRQVLVS
jgi:hypothetical protein